MNYEQFRKIVAENIKIHRKKAKLTQEDMARFGFNVRHYQEIEGGKVDITLGTIFRIASSLQVNPNILLTVRKTPVVD